MKASFDESNYTGPALAIVKAWKKYGLILADQGPAIFISGMSNPLWANTIQTLNNKFPIFGDSLEAVQSPYPIVRGYAANATCNGKTSNDVNPGPGDIVSASSSIWIVFSLFLALGFFIMK
jgi:hypothetical protein